jgi:beta-mannosidase
MDRRTFIKICGMGVAGWGLSRHEQTWGAQLPVPPSGPPLPSRALIFDLGKTAWTLQQAGQSEKLPAQVPGDHYSDLLRAGKIPDPYYRDNNKAVQWAAQTGWIYRTTFESTPQQLAMKYVELVCHGLDTFATVTLNGTTLGSTNNMFRTWVFDVKQAIKPGANDLEIHFQPLPDQAEISGWTEAYFKLHPDVLPDDANHDGRSQSRARASWQDRSWIRKAAYQWGWDWCRPILTMGIWKGIELRAYDSRLAKLAVGQRHAADGSVRLDVTADIAGQPPSGSQVRVRLLEEGAPVEQPVANLTAALTLTIPQPKLWWPNGLGEQNLYTVEVQLMDPEGTVLDTMRKRIGLRQFETVPRTRQLPYTLKVNGQPFFAKGADWIPPDNLLARITPQVLRWFAKDAAACNFNFIRLWGGGFYEDDALFDACDELGIALMFEFKFANASFPSFDQKFIANVKAELEDQILRVRHHPSIAIWSGNNEIRSFVGYPELFDKVIGEAVRQLAPGQPYQNTSGGSGAPDAHDWGLGHGREPFSHYAQTHGFVSEFGIQSYLEPASTRSFATEADLAAGMNSSILQYHERSSQKEIGSEVLRYFGKIPDKLDDLLWLSQIVQAYGLRVGVEHWRQDRPLSTAALIWQYNDSWPGQTWSMIDYYHRWKASQYHARHMFAPVLACGDVDAERGKADIHVINDRLNGGKAMLSWRLATTGGTLLRHNEMSVELPANGNMVAQTVLLSDAEKAAGLQNLLLWMTVTPDGASPQTNISLFALPGQLTLAKSPPIQTKVTGAGRQFTVEISSAQPALWTWINLGNDPDARYSDNFVHLEPGTAVTIDVACGQEHSAADFRNQLAVRSVSEFITPGIALPAILPPSTHPLRPTAPPTGAGQ